MFRNLEYDWTDERGFSPLALQLSPPRVSRPTEHSGLEQGGGRHRGILF